MGTRGVTGFVADGKWYVTYNHFDSYPEFLGMQVLEFCKEVDDWDVVKENVRNVTLVKSDGVPTPEEVYKYSAFLDLSVSSGSSDEWYCLMRNLQGVGILREVGRGNVNHMIDSHRFMADSLFCEWGYIIDLDNMTLNVYKGFNTKYCPDTPLPSDIAIDKFEKSEGSVKNLNGTIESWDNDYYPVKMLHAYNLNRLPKFMLGVTNKFKEEYLKEHSVLQ